MVYSHCKAHFYLRLVLIILLGWSILPQNQNITGAFPHYWLCQLCSVVFAFSIHQQFFKHHPSQFLFWFGNVLWMIFPYADPTFQNLHLLGVLIAFLILQYRIYHSQIKIDTLLYTYPFCLVGLCLLIIQQKQISGISELIYLFLFTILF